MPRVTVAVLALVTVCAVPAVAQNRSNFSGKWTSIPEKSLPANPNAPVTTFVITQEGQKFTTGPASGAANAEAVSTTYVTDGEEHTLPTPPATQPLPGNVATPPAEKTYRAVWTGDQLVTTRTTKKATMTIVTRQVYSIDGEGLLVVEASVASASMPTKSTVARAVFRKGTEAKIRSQK